MALRRFCDVCREPIKSECNFWECSDKNQHSLEICTFCMKDLIEKVAVQIADKND